jgi:hypothetical protein
MRYAEQQSAHPPLHMCPSHATHPTNQRIAYEIIAPVITHHAKNTALKIIIVWCLNSFVVLVAAHNAQSWHRLGHIQNIGGFFIGLFPLLSHRKAFEI